VNATNQELREGAHGTADDKGRYSIVGLEPGTWYVTASAGHRSTAGEVTLKPGAAEARLDLTFPAYWPVSGRVVDPDGTPVAGAHLSLHHRETWKETTSNGADGTFSLQLPDGIYEVVANREGYATTVSADPVIVEGAAVGGVEVRLAAETRLTGRVLGLTPEELAESRVSATQDHAWRDGGLDARAGTYAIEHLGPGDWTVSASHQGEWAVAPLHLAPGEVAGTLDLTFVRGDLTLRGRLRGGDPLANDVVELVKEGEPREHSPVSSPDSQGVFQFKRLRPGRYRLTIQDLNLRDLGGGPSYDQVIELSQDRDLEIELPATPEEASPP